MKVSHEGDYTLRHNNEVIDADLLCEDFFTDSGAYEHDCTLFWNIPKIDAQQTLVYNLTESRDARTASNEWTTITTIPEDVTPPSERNGEKVFVSLHEDSVLFTQGSENLTLSHKYYEGYSNKSEQCSGAYIFRPNEETSEGSLPYNTDLVVKHFTGKVISLVSVKGSNVDYKILMRDAEDGFSFDLYTNVKGLEAGEEVTMNLETSFHRTPQFFTDENGARRVAREFTYPEDSEFFIPANYYPINSELSYQSEAGQALTVLVDRSEGGSSLSTNELELMINRRTKEDDLRGVNEALNETLDDGRPERVYTHHKVFFSHQRDHTADQKLDIDEPLTVFFTQTEVAESTPSTPLFSTLAEKLRVNVRVVADDEILVLLNNYQTSSISITAEELATELNTPSSIDQVTLSGLTTIKENVSELTIDSLAIAALRVKYAKVEFISVSE